MALGGQLIKIPKNCSCQNIKYKISIYKICFGIHKLIHREEDGEKELEDSNSLENKPTNTIGIKKIKVINFGKSKKEKDY